MTHDEFCIDHGLVNMTTADCECERIAAIRADERRIHGIPDPEPEISARDLALSDVYGDKLGRLIGQARHAL